MSGFSIAVLAGGLGTRIQGVSGPTPKALIELAGRPFLDWKLDQLVLSRPSAIYLLVGQGAAEIFEHVSKRDYGVPVALIHDGPHLRGTAGAVLSAASAISGDGFVLTYGDNLLDFPLEVLVEEAIRTGLSTMVATSAVGPSDAPNLEIEENKIISYVSGGRSDLTFVDYGYSWLWKRDVPDPSSDFEHLGALWSQLSSSKRLGAVTTNQAYSEIGTPEGLAQSRDAIIRRSNEELSL